MRSIAAVLMAWFLLQGVALADGMMIPSEDSWREWRERSMINEPEQKAVVFFSRGTEQLIISPSYEGPSNSFAWVVPVPARPKVEILKGALFHELAELTMPRPPKLPPLRKAVRLSAAPQVTVIERKTVGAYDVSVLSATDGQALMKWLKANNYHLPEKAVGPIKSYVRERWTFVASRIKAPQSAQGLHTGTLAPLRLTFKTRKPVYPMRLSSANPGQFNVLVYLVLPSSEIGGKPGAIKATGPPEGYGIDKTYLTATASGYFWKRRQYPTLAKLYNGEMQIYVKHNYLMPAQCTRDITWSPPVHRAAR